MLVTDATVQVREDGGGLVAFGLADEVLSRTAAIRVDIDGRPVTAWDAPEVDGAGLRGMLAGTRVHAAWAAVRVGEGPVWELTLRLRNDGASPVAITRMDPAVLALGCDWETHAYRSGWGTEFQAFSGRTSHDLVLESRSGRSSNGLDPWLGLDRGNAAVVVSPAWSGNWHVHALEGGEITAGISPWRLRVDLAPGEEVVAPSVVVAIARDLDEVAEEMQRAVGRQWLPRTPWTDGLAVEWNSWWPYEDVEVSEEVIAANTRVAADLGIGVVTTDAGWFGAADAASDWQEQRGDWDLVNTERFPSGLAALGDAVRAAGAEAGIWIEAEAVGRSSRLRAERPELLALSDGSPIDPSYRYMTVSVDDADPTFLGYVCLGSEAGRRHVHDAIARLVDETGARWVKLDFNVDPDAGCRRTDHGHGEGDGLLRHYEGLYAVLDAIRARYPQVLLEACASGGLRIDLGLARHVHAFFLSDPDYTEHHLQVLWGARRLLPPVGILHWGWSQWRGDHPPSRVDWAALEPDAFDTMLRAASPHRFGVSLRLPDLRPDLLERLRRHVALYRAVVAPLVRDGVLRTLTAAPERGGVGERAPALQLSAGDRHLVQTFVLPGGGRPEVVRPVGLVADRVYAVTDLGDGGGPRRATGAELAAGIPLTGPATVTSWMLLIEPVETP